jgi:hypothetical protein
MFCFEEKDFEKEEETNKAKNLIISELSIKTFRSRSHVFLRSTTLYTHPTRVCRIASHGQNFQ